MTKLTSLVREVQEGKKPADSVTKEIYLHIFTFLKNRKGLTEDQRSDFLLFFAEKIPGIMRRFAYTGIPFENYLNVHIKFKLKTFLGNCRKTQLYDLVTENVSFISETSLGSGCFTPHRENGGTIELRGTPEISARRILIALLKNHVHFDDEFQLNACTQLGYSRNTVMDWLEQIRCVTESRINRFRRLEERRNMAYLKLFRLQENLRICCCDEEKEKVRDSVTRVTATLRRLNTEMKAVTLHPTHNELSRILGIPKGTIDSSLYYLRSNYSPAAEKKTA